MWIIVVVPQDVGLMSVMLTCSNRYVLDVMTVGQRRMYCWSKTNTGHPPGIAACDSASGIGNYSCEQSTVEAMDSRTIKTYAVKPIVLSPSFMPLR